LIDNLLLKRWRQQKCWNVRDFADLIWCLQLIDRLRRTVSVPATFPVGLFYELYRSEDRRFRSSRRSLYAGEILQGTDFGQIALIGKERVGDDCLIWAKYARSRKKEKEKSISRLSGALIENWQPVFYLSASNAVSVTRWIHASSKLRNIADWWLQNSHNCEHRLLATYSSRALYCHHRKKWYEKLLNFDDKL
jgi:hypothetical protein